MEIIMVIMLIVLVMLLLLTSRQEIREALHRPARRRLSTRDIDAVVVVLKYNGTQPKAS